MAKRKKRKPYNGRDILSLNSRRAPGVPNSHKVGVGRRQDKKKEASKKVARLPVNHE